MLQNVEHANQAKGLTERAVTDVTLNQQTARSSLRVPQTIKPEFQPDNHSVWAGLAKHSKYVSRSASNLEHEVSRLQLGRNLSRQFEDQAVPSTEPEVPVLDASQLFEKRRIIAATRRAARAGILLFRRNCF